DQLLGQRGVHVVDDAAAEAVELVGAERAAAADEGADEQAQENGFLDGVQNVVTLAPREREETPEQGQVANHLAQREANRDIANERYGRRAEHAHAGKLRIVADVVGQNVDAVPGCLQRFEQQPRGDRSATLLIERLWRDDEDTHGRYPRRRS